MSQKTQNKYYVHDYICTAIPIVVVVFIYEKLNFDTARDLACEGTYIADIALRCMVHHPHIEHPTRRQDDGGGWEHYVSVCPLCAQVRGHGGGMDVHVRTCVVQVEGAAQPGQGGG